MNSAVICGFEPGVCGWLVSTVVEGVSPTNRQLEREPRSNLQKTPEKTACTDGPEGVPLAVRKALTPSRYVS
jgi:hypothetical protein